MAGTITQLRERWFAVPDAPADVIRAVNVGGSLTAASDARLEGLWRARFSQLDGVLEADGVGVPDDDHGRRLDPPDVLGGPGEGRHVETLQLLHQRRKVPGVGRDLLVGRFDRGPGEHLGRDARDHLVQLGRLARRFAGATRWERTFEIVR